MADRNGLLKRCDCPAPTKCAHPWYLVFNFGGKQNWISLPKHQKTTGDKRPVDSLTLAAVVAEEIRVQIRRDEKYAPVKPKPTADAAAVAMTYDTLVERFERDVLNISGIETKADVLARLKKLAVVDVPDLGRFGNLQVADITVAAVRHAFASTSDWSWSTRSKYAVQLKRILRYAVEQRWLDRLPLAKDTLKVEAGTMRDRRVEPFEESNLIEAARESRDVSGQRLGVLIIAAIECGARLGELLALRWADVRWADGVLKIRATEQGARKSGKGKGRDVPLTERLRAALEPLQVNAAGERFGSFDYVFGDATGKRIKTIRKAWDTTRLRAHNLPVVWGKNAALAPASQAKLDALDLHFHDLRHECALRWHERGLPLSHIATLLGHRDLLTLEVYLGVRSKDALTALRGLLTGSGRCPTCGRQHEPAAAAPPVSEGQISKPLANGKSARLISKSQKR